MRKHILILLLTVLFGSIYSEGWAVKVSTLEKRLLRSADSFENVTQSELGAIPPVLLAKAHGILIFRQYEAGFGIGGKGGSGVALARDRSGRWGSPAFFKSGEGSIGFQIGAQRLDVVFLFMDDNAMKIFYNPKFRIGVDAAAVAGPVGANVEGKIGAPILVYTDTAGLYAGATFEGGFLVPDKEANETIYGVPGISAPDILYKGGVGFPNAATDLVTRLYRYSGENVAPPSSKRNWWEPKRPHQQGYQVPHGGPKY